MIFMIAGYSAGQGGLRSIWRFCGGWGKEQRSQLGRTGQVIKHKKVLFLVSELLI